MTLKARGCKTFCGTISATVVRIIPTVPLLAPAKALAAIAHARERENPNRSDAHIVQNNPIKMIGFRPNRSEARPQAMAVIH